MLKPFDGPDSARDYVVSKNLRRRNLTTGQKAMAWEKLCNLTRGGNSGVTKAVEGNGTNLSIGLKQAAEDVGIHHNTIKQARQVTQHGSPELIKAVESGRVAVSAAAKVAKDLPDHKAQAQVVEAAKDEPRKLVAIAKEHKAKPAPAAYITLTQWEVEGVECADTHESRPAKGARFAQTASLP